MFRDPDVQPRSTSLLAWLVLFALMLVTPRAALAGQLDIDRPGQREFVVDHANLLSNSAEDEIREIAEQLLNEHATPIVVITIESMAAHGGQRMDIETFSRILFDQWGVGHPVINDAQWNTGILLVISKQDRKARIELGGGWGHGKDAEAERIMDRRIIPRFKDGDYSRGAIDGVWALDAMARSKPLPPSSGSRSLYWTDYLWLALGLLVVVLVLKSLIQSGREGWGWKLIVLVFTILSGVLMVLAFLSRFSGSCRGRSSLGSFGGGSSGGGGATGSW